jgi:hypothetical protein
MQSSYEDARVFLRIYEELTAEELEKVDEAISDRNAHRETLEEIQSELDALSPDELQDRHKEEEEYLNDVDDEFRSNASSNFCQHDPLAIEDERRVADVRTQEDFHEIMIANRYPGAIDLLEGWIEKKEERLSRILLEAAKRAR